MTIATCELDFPNADQGPDDRILAAQERNELPVVLLDELIDRRRRPEPLVERLEEVTRRAVALHLLLPSDKPAQ